MNIFCTLLFQILLTVLCSCSGTESDPGNRIRLNLNNVGNYLKFYDSVVVYSCWDSSVVVFDLNKDREVYKRSLRNICYTTPKLIGNNLYLPVSDSEFSVIDVTTDQIGWTVKLNGRCNGI